MYKVKESGLFYGWYVVGSLFFASVLAMGLRQGFGVFVATWERELGASVAAISVAGAVGWLANGVSQPVFGRLADQFGGKRVLVGSLIAMGVGAAATSLARSVYGLIAFYGIIVSLASGGVSFTTSGVVVAKWFRRKRGLAMGFLAAGGSVGGLILVPFAGFMLFLTDWGIAWLVLGGIILCLGVPLLILVVRSSPAELGLFPDGEGDATGVAPSGRQTGSGPLFVEEWWHSFRSAPIWQLSATFMICGVTTASISVHYVRWAVSEDISPGAAALAFGVLSGINGIAVFLISAISDKMQRKTLLTIVYLVRGVAFLGLMLLPGVAALWFFAVVGGMSWLATVPLTTSLAADVYGLKHLGTLAGLINLAHQVGGAAAVFLFGLVFDFTGSYDAGFLGGAILLGFAGALALSIRESNQSARYARMDPPLSTHT